MGRAIVRQPQVFLMDEPLSNLDAKLRVQTRTQIASLQRRLGVTTVYVTHDQTEALTMGDRIAVLKDGVLQQVGTPRDLYEKPQNVFVAGFIGSPAMNLLPADVVDGGIQFGTAVASVDRDVLGQATGSKRHHGRPPRGRRRRPRRARASRSSSTSSKSSVPTATSTATPRSSGQRVDIVVRVDGRNHPSAGDTIYITPQAAPRARLRHRDRSAPRRQGRRQRVATPSDRPVGTARSHPAPRGPDGPLSSARPPPNRRRPVPPAPRLLVPAPRRPP